MEFPNIQGARTEGMPLYSYIEYLIRNMMIRGQLEPGERLPSEEKLAEQFGVSLVTIRTALSRLSDEGLIVRNRPKGTFVTDSLSASQPIIVSGGIYDIVSEAMRYDVQALGIDTLKVSETRNAREIRSFLKLSNEDSISVVRRVRLMKGTPVYFLENFIPPDFADKITVTKLTKKPLLKILKEEAGLALGRGEMFIQAVPAEHDVAEALRVQLFEPLILMQVYYWFQSGEPFEIVNLFMRSEYFKYKVELDAEGFEKI